MEGLDPLQGAAALFPNPADQNRERRWHSNVLRLEWNRAAGVRVRMYEGTKHSLATGLLERMEELGIDSRHVQEILRHANARSTERYARLTPSAAVLRLEGRVRRG